MASERLFDLATLVSNKLEKHNALIREANPVEKRAVIA